MRSQLLIVKLHAAQTFAFVEVRRCQENHFIIAKVVAIVNLHVNRRLSLDLIGDLLTFPLFQQILTLNIIEMNNVGVCDARETIVAVPVDFID